ncbi:MAG: NAD/NADP octopine/nopaline dehydrogenase family protein [Acidobacteriota bacterium]|nr:NAD/NADP octopine/nopaline dehydrogenase family protein [Acidobacteriota bacterium]
MILQNRGIPIDPEHPMQITICGAGRLGHVLIGLLGGRPGIRLHVLSRNAETLNRVMPGSGVAVLRPGTSCLHGKADLISDRPQDVIPGSRVVLLTVPSQVRPRLLTSLVPFLDRDHPVFVGGIPGLGAFDWVAAKTLADMDNVVIWGIKDVPYTCSHLQPGRQVTLLGSKKRLFLALHADHFERWGEEVATIVKDLFRIPVELIDDFLAITLTPGNQIMHPAILCGMFGPQSQWDGKPLPTRPLFYAQCSELSAELLSLCDEEVQHIKTAALKFGAGDLTCVWPLRQNLKEVYGDQVADNRTLLAALRTNSAYATIRAPLKAHGKGWTLDREHRVFAEDVPFGLEILIDLAHRLNVQVPTLQKVRDWAREVMGHVDETGVAYIPESWPHYR